MLALLATDLGPEEGNFDDWMFAAALLLLATLPYAFWLGALRSRLWEASVVADENVRLDAELQPRLDELRESRARIVEAGYAERKRVERDLHDGAQQRLVALAIELQVVRSKLQTDPAPRPSCSRAPPASWPAPPRSCGSSPAGCTRRCWPTAAWCPPSRRSRAGRRCRYGRGRRGRARAGGRRGGRLLRRLRGADQRRSARGRRPCGGARRAGTTACSSVEIEDDGAGGADLAAGSGLRGLSDRVGALDGSLQVESKAGRGTTVRASLPVLR